MRSRSPMVLALAALAAVVLASASSGQTPGAPGPPSGPPPGWEKALAAKERHAARMLDKPGVAGIGVGVNTAGKAVIRIYEERADVADVPDVLDDVPVETRTTGILQARAPTDRFPRPVPIGVSSGHLDTATGTLGARVTDGTNVFALSNNHVYAALNTASIGDGIIQPGNVDGGSDPADRIGTLHAFEPINFTDGTTNTIDAALASVTTATVGTATPPDGYGTPNPVTAPAVPGLAVQKYGRTTGHQVGSVVEVGVTVDVCYFFIPPDLCLEDARFVDQISVTPDAFSASGDSGSLIVTQGGNQPVALLFAGGEGLTIGNPIDAVLQRFGVTIDGTVPPDGPPSAPTGLSAVAGAGSVSLSWSAPAFDGGSPLTGYRIYRGTSAGGESFLQSVGTVTSFQDTGLVNGTTYYYKVSAENATGEGPLSNEASATPTDLVAPTEPLPVVDGFNRPDENPLSDGGGWGNGVLGSSETGLFVTANQLACSRTTTCTAWRSAAQYGPDAESWLRVSTAPGAGNTIRLYVRVQSPGSAALDGYMAFFNQLAGVDQVVVHRVTNGASTPLLTVNQDYAAGDILLLRAKGTSLETWRFDGAWSRIGVVQDATYGAAGYTGVGLRGTTGRLDDFGARSSTGGPPPDLDPPTAPGALLASAVSSTQIDLSWQAATDNVGVTLYRIERCQGAGCSLFSEIATTTATGYSNTSLDPATSYSYRVRAEDAAGNRGPYSNQASATTSDLVPPVEPLPVVDGFNRPDENPLSDSGRWGNGVLGSGERSLRVISNRLASGRNTTTTAWRNDVQYGPDCEAWATIATLPGNGNTFRLYVRLQTPGSAAVDGYMLNVTQRAGTDEFVLHRVTNGVSTALATGLRELTVGSRILLRARGTALEAWLHNGSSWTRVLRVTDATYTGGGYVGVGIRGKTGRLDDFGAR